MSLSTNELPVALAAQASRPPDRLHSSLYCPCVAPYMVLMPARIYGKMVAKTVIQPAMCAIVLFDELFRIAWMCGLTR